MKKKHPIAALIEQGEHQQLDLKFEVSDSKKIARTLSGSCITDGGRLKRLEEGCNGAIISGEK